MREQCVVYLSRSNDELKLKLKSHGHTGLQRDEKCQLRQFFSLRALGIFSAQTFKIDVACTFPHLQRLLAIAVSTDFGSCRTLMNLVTPGEHVVVMVQYWGC